MNLVRTSFHEKLFHCFALLLLLASYSGCGANSPRFVSSALSSARHKSVQAGRSITLDCLVSGLNSHSVSWIKSNTKAILSLNKHLVTQNSRYQLFLQETKETGNFQLTISNVTLEDNGTYICQVNTEPPINQETNVSVVTSPWFTNTSETVNMVASGNPLFLNCKAEGVPRPTVFWKREGKRNMSLVDRGSVSKFKGVVLPLASLSRSEVGKYICIADNGYPPIIMKTFLVKVMYEPHVRVAKSRIKAEIGSTVSLVCNIQAYPSPIIIWKKIPEEVLGNAQVLHISDEVTEGRLTIRNITYRSFGEYECLAKNKLGTAISTIFIEERRSRDRERGGKQSQGGGRLVIGPQYPTLPPYEQYPIMTPWGGVNEVGVGRGEGKADDRSVDDRNKYENEDTPTSKHQYKKNYNYFEELAMNSATTFKLSFSIIIIFYYLIFVLI